MAELRMNHTQTVNNVAAKVDSGDSWKYMTLYTAEQESRMIGDPVEIKKYIRTYDKAYWLANGESLGYTVKMSDTSKRYPEVQEYAQFTVNFDSDEYIAIKKEYMEQEQHINPLFPKNRSDNAVMLEQYKNTGDLKNDPDIGFRAWVADKVRKSMQETYGYKRDFICCNFAHVNSSELHVQGFMHRFEIDHDNKVVSSVQKLADLNESLSNKTRILKTKTD